MTDKQLHRLRRSELLELLLIQEKEIAALKKKLDAANAALQNREVLISTSGSIAEAALRLNGVFEAAQAAADQYLASVKSSASREQV